MKIADILNNPSLSYLIGIFPDLSYETGLWIDLSTPFYSTSRPKTRGIFENFEVIYSSTFAGVRFFYQYKDIKVYYQRGTPIQVGNNHNGKRIKNIHDIETLRKQMTSEGYNFAVVDKALKHIQTLAIDIPPLERIMKDKDFSYYESTNTLDVYEDCFTLKELNDIAQLMGARPEKFRVKIEQGENDKLNFELEWSKEEQSKENNGINIARDITRNKFSDLGLMDKYALGKSRT